MKKLHSILLLATLAISSCGNNGSHKPLMGGVSDTYATTRSSNDSQVGNQKTTGAPTDNAPQQTEGMEIPAPLNNVPEQLLKRTGYTASYNCNTLIPNWVAWCLTAGHTEGDVKRPRKAFAEDEEVNAPRADDWDYYNSGFDRGHLCPAADNKWNEKAMLESFLFTNICPQNHNLNCGDWSELENACRKWAKRYGCIYIVSGPILYKTKHKTIGKHKVTVPEAFFKVVLRMGEQPCAIGFIYKNQAGNRPKGDYVNTVDEVERITGIDFFHTLPDELENSIEATANLNDWEM